MTLTKHHYSRHADTLLPTADVREIFRRITMTVGFCLVCVWGWGGVSAFAVEAAVQVPSTADAVYIVAADLKDESLHPMQQTDFVDTAGGPGVTSRLCQRVPTGASTFATFCATVLRVDTRAWSWRSLDPAALTPTRSRRVYTRVVCSSPGPRTDTCHFAVSGGSARTLLPGQPLLTRGLGGPLDLDGNSRAYFVLRVPVATCQEVVVRVRGLTQAGSGLAMPLARLLVSNPLTSVNPLGLPGVDLTGAGATKTARLRVDGSGLHKSLSPIAFGPEATQVYELYLQLDSPVDSGVLWTGSVTAWVITNTADAARVPGTLFTSVASAVDGAPSTWGTASALHRVMYVRVCPPKQRCTGWLASVAQPTLPVLRKGSCILPQVWQWLVPEHGGGVGWTLGASVPLHRLPPGLCDCR